MTSDIPFVIDKPICLLGLTRNTHNYGIHVLLSSTVELLSSYAHNNTIYILDYGRSPDTWREHRSNSSDITLDLINLRFNLSLTLSNNIIHLLAVLTILYILPFRCLKNHIYKTNLWIRRLYNTQAFFAISGGDSFSDIYGIRRFIYVSLPQILVLLARKPLIQLPQTYGPFNSLISRLIARFILKRSTSICSRDKDGISTVRSIIGHKQALVDFIPDLGFCLQPDPLAPQVTHTLTHMRKQSTLVGLNISKLLFMGGYRRHMFSLKEDYPDLIRRLIEALILQYSTTVLLIAHVGGDSSSRESEITLNRTLVSELSSCYGNRLLFLEGPFSARQTKAIIGMCDLFIGARMHACIAAASSYVPTIALAYSDKFAGVLNPVGSGARVLDLRIVRATDVINEVGMALGQRTQLAESLKKSVPNIKRQIFEYFSSQMFSSLLSLPQHSERAYNNRIV